MNRRRVAAPRIRSARMGITWDTYPSREAWPQEATVALRALALYVSAHPELGLVDEFTDAEGAMVAFLEDDEPGRLVIRHAVSKQALVTIDVTGVPAQLEAWRERRRSSGHRPRP